MLWQKIPEPGASIRQPRDHGGRVDRLTILGVGHSEAIDHWNNNALVTADGRHMLIDAGYTVKYALRDQGLSIRDIEAVFLTHVHADHAFGLERIGLECRFHYGFRPRLYLPDGLREELWDQTLKGVMGRLGEGPTSLDDFFDVRPVTSGGFEFQGVVCKPFANRHTPGKVSYGLLLNGHLLYSGDTRPIPRIIETFDPRTIFHDCTLRPGNPVHATLEEMVRLYRPEIRERIYLMSYEDNWRDYRQAVESQFRGFAWQGQEVAL